jgi:uncharacterized membrane protein YeiB
MATTLTRDGLSPIAPQQRIVALDVIRGFALLGIFLMNIEWFNRPITDLGSGMPVGVGGLDHAVGWVIHTFIRSKFWTMFSLLFGMGFAVMLGRAEAAGRGFLGPYLRRVVALALIGLAHGILLWTGDILLSYASAAAVLLLTLFGRAWHGLVLIALIALVAATLKAPIGGFAGVLLLAVLLGLYLRSERTLRIGGRDWPLPAAVLAGLGLLMMVGGGIAVAMQGSKFAGVVIGGAITLGLAFLVHRYRGTGGERVLRAGLFLYFAPVLAMLIGAASAMLSPQGQGAQQAPEQQQKIEAQRAERRAERQATIDTERRVMTTGTYTEAVQFRAKEYLGDYVGQSGFLAIILSLFLIGTWFVQSGAIVEPARHLRLFRRLAWVGLPAGTAVSVLSSLLATSHVPGENSLQWQLAMGLQMLGALPMSLGYMAVIVLALQSARGRSLLGGFAPTGRMALTHYLSQTVICSLVFYGYGFGQWGMPRAWQVVFVIAVFVMQALFSRWWLARYRYGPMEWIWRGATYLQWPRMRRNEVAIQPA